MALPGIESVVTQCGEHRNLLVRNLRNDTAVARVHKYRKNLTSPHQKYNVMFIFLDAVSRRNFLRTLPETVKFIEHAKDTEQQTGVSVFQFLRYDKSLVDQVMFCAFPPRLAWGKGAEHHLICES